MEFWYALSLLDYTAYGLWEIPAALNQFTQSCTLYTRKRRMEMVRWSGSPDWLSRWSLRPGVDGLVQAPLRRTLPAPYQPSNSCAYFQTAARSGLRVSQIGIVVVHVS